MTAASRILREARARAAMSQRSAAAASGVAQPVFSRVESGRQDPSLTTLRRLTRAYGFDVEVTLEPMADPHDVSLLDVTLPLTPTQRVQRLVTLHRTAERLRSAVA